MNEEDREILNNLNRETLLLKTELAESQTEFKKKFTNLKNRVKKLLLKINSKLKGN